MVRRKRKKKRKERKRNRNRRKMKEREVREGTGKVAKTENTNKTPKNNISFTQSDTWCDVIPELRELIVLRVLRCDVIGVILCTYIPVYPRTNVCIPNPNYP